eukprot:g783.t1
MAALSLRGALEHGKRAEKKTSSLRGALEHGKRAEKIAPRGGCAIMNLAASVLRTPIVEAPTSSTLFEVVLLQKKKILLEEARRRQAVQEKEKIHFSGWFEQNLRQRGSNLCDAYNLLMGGKILRPSAKKLQREYSTLIRKKGKLELKVDHERLLPLLFKIYKNQSVLVLKGSLLQMTLFGSGLVGAIEETKLYGRQHFVAIHENKRRKGWFLLDSKAVKPFPLSGKSERLVYAVVDCNVTLPLLPNRRDVAAMGGEPGPPWGGRRKSLVPLSIHDRKKKQYNDPAQFVSVVDRDLENGSRRVKGMITQARKRVRQLQSYLNSEALALEEDYQWKLKALLKAQKRLLQSLPKSTRDGGICINDRKEIDYRESYSRQRILDDCAGSLEKAESLVKDLALKPKSTKGKGKEANISHSALRARSFEVNGKLITVEDLADDNFLAKSLSDQIFEKVRNDRKNELQNASLKWRRDINREHFSRRQRPAAISKDVKARIEKRLTKKRKMKKKRKDFVMGRHSEKLRKKVKRIKLKKLQLEKEKELERERVIEQRKAKEFVIGEKILNELKKRSQHIGNEEIQEETTPSFNRFFGLGDEEEDEEKELDSDEELMQEMEEYRRKRQAVLSRDRNAGNLLMRKRNARTHCSVVKYFGEYFLIKCFRRNIGILDGVQLTATRVNGENDLFNRLQQFKMYVPDTKDCRAASTVHAIQYLSRCSFVPRRGVATIEGRLYCIKVWSVYSGGVQVLATDVKTHKTRKFFVSVPLGGTDPKSVAANASYLCLDLYGRMKYKESFFQARVSKKKAKWNHVNPITGETWVMPRKRMKNERQFANLVESLMKIHREKKIVAKRAKWASHAAAIAASRAVPVALTAAASIEWMVNDPQIHVNAARDYLLQIGYLKPTEEDQENLHHKRKEREQQDIVELKLPNNDFTSASIKTQSTARGFLVRREYIQKKSSAIQIQRIQRGKLQRSHMDTRRNAQTIISRYRRASVRRRIERNDCSQIIQSHVRRKQRRKHFKRKKEAAICVQSRVRAKLAREWCKKERRRIEEIPINAANKIAATFRASVERERFVLLRNGVIRLQQMFRGGCTSVDDVVMNRRRIRALRIFKNAGDKPFIVTIQLLEGTQLLLFDDDEVQSVQKPSPYVKLSCPMLKKKYTSITKKNTSDPDWKSSSERFEFTFESLEILKISFIFVEVFSNRLIGKDPLLGTFKINLSDCIEFLGSSRTFSKALDKAGFISFVASADIFQAKSKKGLKKMQRVGDNSPLGKGNVKLTLEVVSATDLPKANPYVRLLCSGQNFKTKTIRKTRDPVYHQQFSFHFDSILVCRESRIDFQILDWNFKKRSKYHTVIGLAALHLDKMTVGELTENIIDLEGDNGSLTVWTKLSFDAETTLQNYHSEASKAEMESLNELQKRQSEMESHREKVATAKKNLNEIKEKEESLILHFDMDRNAQQTINKIMEKHKNMKKSLEKILMEEFPIQSEVKRCKVAICNLIACATAVAAASFAHQLSILANAKCEVIFAENKLSLAKNGEKEGGKLLREAESVASAAKKAVILERRKHGLADDTELSELNRLKALESNHCVVIEILEGFDLPLLDKGRTSDPYITAKASDGQTQKTKVIKKIGKDDTAKWYEVIKFEFTDLKKLKDARIRFKMFDQDIGLDDLMGMVVLNISEIIMQIGFGAGNFEERILKFEPNGHLKICISIGSGRYGIGEAIENARERCYVMREE